MEKNCLDLQQRQKGFKISFFEGIFSNLLNGFVNEYVIPFLLLINGTARQAGLLSALPNLLVALGQIKVADFNDQIKSRKRVLAVFCLLQAGILIIIAVMALLKIKAVYWFIGCVVLYTAFGAWSQAPGLSWLSDLVPEDKRGEYFGRRNKILGLMMILASLGTGFYLQAMKQFDLFVGFAVVFTAAALVRIFSLLVWLRIYEPKLSYDHRDSFSILQFFTRIKQSNFAQFVLFCGLMNFSVNVGSPFFSVFMLRDLKFSYPLYSFVVLSASGTVFLLMGRWGRLADHAGNLRVIKFCSPLIGCIPFLWLFNHHPVYLVFAQLVSGLAWSGFNLSAANFIYDAVSPQKRIRCICYFSAVTGFGLFAGGVLGGYLVQKVPQLLGYQILMILVISGVLRFICAILLPTNLKEVRAIKPMTNQEIWLRMLGIKKIPETIKS